MLTLIDFKMVVAHRRSFKFVWSFSRRNHIRLKRLFTHCQIPRAAEYFSVALFFSFVILWQFTALPLQQKQERYTDEIIRSHSLCFACSEPRSYHPRFGGHYKSWWSSHKERWGACNLTASVVVREEESCRLY